MTVTWLPASLSNTEISNPLNIFCHLKIQCFVTDVSSTSGGFGFQDLNFFDFLQSDKELDLSEDVATTYNSQVPKSTGGSREVVYGG